MLAVIFLAGCTPIYADAIEPAQDATAVSQLSLPTNTTIPTDTLQPPTSSPTSSLTPTIAPSATPTPTSTPTNSTTPSATASSTPTRPLPTLTPTATARPAAPLFAETLQYPFDRVAFVDALTQAQNVYYAKLFFFQYVKDGHPGNCNAYVQFMQDVKNLPGFVDVPDSWYSLYYEYRALLAQTPAVTVEIANVCAAGGGEVSSQTDQAVVDFVDNTQKRLYQMISEAQSMP
jgi:hypothetical protein